MLFQTYNEPVNVWRNDAKNSSKFSKINGGGELPRGKTWGSKIVGGEKYATLGKLGFFYLVASIDHPLW